MYVHVSQQLQIPGCMQKPGMMGLKTTHTKLSDNQAMAKPKGKPSGS